MAKTSALEVDGEQVTVSNLDKVFYPQTGFTKGDVINYYIKAAPVLLPHLRNRPLTMKRYPNGVDAPYFYEKQCPRPRPTFVETAAVARQHEPGTIDYCLVNNLPTLVWAANLGDLELHTFLSRAPKVEQPTQIVFDLDPGAPADAVQCAQVALWLREMFGRLGIEIFVKSSGSKGLQVYVPLNTPITYEETSPLAKAVAQTLERAHPEFVVSDMKRALRKGKVLVDWSQNSETKTTVSVYSLRAKERPFASVPLEWAEVEKVLKKRDPSLAFFDAAQALKRIDKKGDLFAPVLTLKQDLQKALAGLRSASDDPPEEKSAKKAPAKSTAAKVRRLKGLGDGSIEAYNAKRDFTRTSEPSGKKTASGAKLLFVIQKHAASHLHYDFRLELDGVLKSWAVPKGPPFDRETKRLAMMVEDHPLDYARFEGIIPAGNYGAGTVMVWDIGTWENLGPEPHEGLRSGKLHFRLAGKKLKGEWALVKMHGPRATRGTEWLMLKHGDDMRPVSVAEDDMSALSGRSMDEIRTNGLEWHGQRVADEAGDARAKAPSFKSRVAALARQPQPPVGQKRTRRR